MGNPETIPKIVLLLCVHKLLRTKQMGKAQNAINLAINGWWFMVSNCPCESSEWPSMPRWYHLIWVLWQNTAECSNRQLPYNLIWSNYNLDWQRWSLRVSILATFHGIFLSGCCKLPGNKQRTLWKIRISRTCQALWHQREHPLYL